MFLSFILSLRRDFCYRWFVCFLCSPFLLIGHHPYHCLHAAGICVCRFKRHLTFLSPHLSRKCLLPFAQLILYKVWVRNGLKKRTSLENTIGKKKTTKRLNHIKKQPNRCAIYNPNPKILKAKEIVWRWRLERAEDSPASSFVRYFYVKWTRCPL